MGDEPEVDETDDWYFVYATTSTTFLDVSSANDQNCPADVHEGVEWTESLESMEVPINPVWGDPDDNEPTVVRWFLHNPTIEDLRAISGSRGVILKGAEKLDRENIHLSPDFEEAVPGRFAGTVEIYNDYRS